MSVNYTYSVSEDFPNSAVDPARFKQEIEASSIVTALAEDFIQVSGDDCDVWFKASLSSGDESTLNSLVASHSGVPLDPDPESVVISGARYDEDKKQVVVITPAPRGSYTWYTSFGDVTDPLNRGGGDPARITYTVSGTGTKNVHLNFSDGVYVHDGEINWRPVEEFSGEDTFSVYIDFPATTAITTNSGTTGNCDLFNIGGPYNAIVPNPTMSGAYDVDLDEAVPVPDSSGSWYVNEKTGTIVAGEGTGEFDRQCVLLDFQAPRMFLIRNLAMTSIRGLFEINAYLVEWISPRWEMYLEVDKNKIPEQEVEVTGTLMLFRWNATESS